MIKTLYLCTGFAVALTFVGCYSSKGSESDDESRSETSTVTTDANRKTADALAKRGTRRSRTTVMPRPGSPSPELTGFDTHDERMRLAEYRDQIVMLDFWGNWCPRCRALFPHQRALVDHLKDKPFVLVGVNSDQDTDTPNQLFESGEVTWRSFQNELGGEKISDKWGIRGWPTVFLIDGKGVIRFAFSADELEDPMALDEAIALLLEELGESFPADAIKAATETE